MKNLSIDELEDIQESEKISTHTKNVIDILIAAINDWPDEVLSLEAYESEVNGFIGGEVTSKKIKKALKRIDFSKGVWKAESLSQLIDLLKLYNFNMSLKEIITELKIKLEEEKLM